MSGGASRSVVGLLLLLLEQGIVCTIYRDLINDAWYEQRA